MKARTRVLALGAVVGALLGAAAGALYLRSLSMEEDREGEGQLPSVHPAKALAVGLTALTLLRQVVGLGRPD